MRWLNIKLAATLINRLPRHGEQVTHILSALRRSSYEYMDYLLVVQDFVRTPTICIEY